MVISKIFFFFFNDKVVRHWNRLPKGVVDATSLEVCDVVKDAPAPGRGVGLDDL